MDNLVRSELSSPRPMDRTVETNNDVDCEKVGIVSEQDKAMIPPKTSIYKGLKHGRYKTDEEKANRRAQKLEYAKEYYQKNKQKINKQNMDAWKKRRRYLTEMGNDPRVIEFYEKIKNSE